MKPKKSRGTFHYERSLNRKNQRLSLKRRLGSVVALSLSGVICYTAMHYIPAFINTSKLLSISNINISAQRLSAKADKHTISRYLDVIKIKRAYLRGGQNIMAQYALPDNSRLELEIVKCRRSLFFEVFKCVPEGKQNIVINDKTVGSQKFSIGHPGFYEFRNVVVQANNKTDDYKILWRRS